jgi:tetratricopeptide (TPR) repeat protein
MQNKIQIVLAILLLCGCHERINHKEQSAKYFQKASEIHLRNLGNNDSISYAILLLDTAIKLDKNNLKYYYSRGQFSMEANKYDSVVDNSNQILEIEKNNFTALFLKGIAFNLAGKNDSAAHSFRLALNSLASMKFKNLLFKEYQEIVLYGLLNDSINFKKGLDDFEVRFKKENGFSELYAALIHFDKKDYLDSFH